MCINASNFFTRSRPIWETRGSLTLPALRALPRISGSDPGGSEVRTPLQGGQICGRAAPPAPAPTASTAGIGIGPAMDTELRGNLQPSLAFIYVFYFTVPGVYLVLQFPRGQFTAPKRSSRFELNTANKISTTLITPCMNISFT